MTDQNSRIIGASPSMGISTQRPSGGLPLFDGRDSNPQLSARMQTCHAFGRGRQNQKLYATPTSIPAVSWYVYITTGLLSLSIMKRRSPLRLRPSIMLTGNSTPFILYITHIITLYRPRQAPLFARISPFRR